MWDGLYVGSKLITVSNFVHNYLSQYIKIILLSTLHFIYMLKHMTLCQKNL